MGMDSKRVPPAMNLSPRSLENPPGCPAQKPVSGDRGLSWTCGDDPALEHLQSINESQWSNAAEIHKIRNTTSGQTFARKLIKPYGTVTLTDILNELRAVEKLCRSGHDHVVEVFRHGKLIGSDLYYFIDMEFCEGSLDDYICGKPIGKEGLILNANSPNTRAIDYCWIIISDICDGLTFIHHAKEVHRDLKPFNVLYSTASAAWKITDFGLAADRPSTAPLLTENSRGTSSYRAPELLQEDSVFTETVDIWGLGCILFELVVGKRAFTGDWAVREYIVSGRLIPVPLEGLVDGESWLPLTNLIRMLCHIDPQKRPNAQALCLLFNELVEHGLRPVSIRTSSLFKDIWQPFPQPSDLYGEFAECQIRDFPFSFSKDADHTRIDSLDISIPLFEVPHERNPHFAGRSAILDTLRHKLLEKRPRRYNHRVAIHGLGGVGKTQIALEYAYRHRSDYTYMLWISAADQTEMLSRFEIVGRSLGLPISNQSASDTAKSVLEWLKKTERWLVVYDNLDEVTVINGYLPTNHGTGHTLITTRNRNTDCIPASGLEVDVMGLDECVMFLLDRVNLSNAATPEILTQATEMVKELGYLPLAVEQAASYVRMTHSIGEFLNTYKEQRQELLSWRPTGNYPYNHTVATTWKLSLQILKSSCPSSIILAQYLAFLNPDEVLLDFLEVAWQDPPSDIETILSNKFALRESLYALESFSLVRVLGEGRKVEMHRLVQVVMQDDIDMATRNKIISSLIVIALNKFPEVAEESHRTACRRYRSQVIALLEYGPCAEAPQWHVLSGRLASYLHQDGHYVESVHWWTRTLDIRDQVLGHEHPDTLQSMQGLAASYYSVNDNEQSRKLYAKALNVQKRTLGSEHPATLTSMNGLARAYYVLGRTADTYSLFKDTYEIRRRTLGAEHPDTLVSLTGLAETYQKDLGQTEEAARLHEGTLRIRRQILGEEHLDTLTSMSLLAWAYYNLGRMKESADLNESSLELRRKVLGSEHPNTLLSVNNLALAYHGLGKTGEAIALIEKLIDIRMRLLGIEHVDTQWSIHGLANMYNCLGRADEAAVLHEKMMEVRKRVMGNEHLDTLKSMVGLADSLNLLGRPSEALELSQRASEIQEQKLGPEHPTTLTSLNSRAEAYHNLGRLEEAEELHRRILEARRRLLGRDHPDSLLSMHNLGVTYRKLGQIRRAEQLLGETLESRIRVLGMDHPDTLATIKCVEMQSSPIL